jgi:hypothetical protein
MINNQRNPTKELAEEDFFAFVGTNAPKSESARKLREIVDRIEGGELTSTRSMILDWE